MTGLGENEKRIAELRKNRKWAIILLLLLIALPIFVAPIAFIQFEASPDLTYVAGLAYSTEQLTGIEMNSTLTLHSSTSLALVSCLGVLKIVGIGFVAGTLITTLEIQILKGQRPPEPPR